MIYSTLLWGALALHVTGVAPGPAPEAESVRVPGTTFCRAAGPEYYAIPLTTTKNIPGTGLARGKAELSVPSSSPFPVALGADGHYVYELRVSLERMRAPSSGRLVAWVTTSELDRVARLSALDDNLIATGPVSWNKFIVVVTLEPEDNPSAETWTGPIVFRGMSRSGAMHTMLGHGALQQENCTSYGFGG